MKLILQDMAVRGWLIVDLAKQPVAGMPSAMTLGRFLRGEVQTARTIEKIAAALGHPVSRYFTEPEGDHAAAPVEPSLPSLFDDQLESAGAR
ncbi:MAG TPA: hypothetical protein VM364_07905 [Vicinamibacterales bacterium]|nr:hypothetical protein [Vicinamibacterales bacterium]